MDHIEEHILWVCIRIIYLKDPTIYSDELSSFGVLG